MLCPWHIMRSAIVSHPAAARRRALVDIPSVGKQCKSVRRVRLLRGARIKGTMVMELPVLIVAPLTPFTVDLNVDAAGLRRQIDYIIDDCRATMVVAAGVETQEYTYLSFEQRKMLIRQTIGAVGQRVPVMVGISHASFKTS